MKPSTPYGRAKASPMLRTLNRGSAQDLAADNLELFAVSLIVLAALLLLKYLTNSFGLGVTPDAVDYFSVADSLLHGRWFTQYDGQPMVLWPPLYPALLAIFSLVMKPMAAAKVLNGACLAGTVLTAWSWTRRGFGRAAGVVAAVGIALSPVLLMSCMAWSEPLFLLLTVAGLAAVDRYRSTGRGLRWAAALAGLAALTRYPGVALIVAGGILTLAGPGSGRRWRDTFEYLLLASLPLAFWLGRNWLVAGTLTGPRYPASVGLVGALGQAAVAVARWAPVDSHPLGFALVAAGTLAGAVVILFALQAEKSLFVSTLAVFSVVYGTALTLMCAYVAMDHINGRLISPLYVPALFLILGGLSCLPQVWPSRLTRGLMVAGLILIPLVSAVRLAQVGSEIFSYGPGGYTRVEWRDSPTAAWLKDHPLPRPIYANEPGAVYWFARQPALPSPSHHPFHSPFGPADGPEKLAAGGSLVLFTFADPRFLTGAELQPAVDLTPVAQFTDGAVYRVSPRPRPQ